jgi:hypothetical protein
MLLELFKYITENPDPSQALLERLKLRPIQEREPVVGLIY